MAPVPLKKDWALSKHALDLLLDALGPDRDRAGEQYELLRRKLLKFFQWRGGASPEDLADESLNVLARKLVEGEVVQNLGSYALGIARNVLSEHVREGDRVRAGQADPLFARAEVADHERERLLDGLEHSMAELPADSRRLLLIYYGGDKRARIDARRALASELGIEMNALRIRAFRLRARLEREVIGRLNGPGKGEK